MKGRSVGNISWQAWLAIAPSSVLIAGIISYTVITVFKRKDFSVKIGKNGIEAGNEECQQSIHDCKQAEVLILLAQGMNVIQFGLIAVLHWMKEKGANGSTQEAIVLNESHIKAWNKYLLSKGINS